ncbi:hypothetical protein HAX54_030088 [Datura stramonium]|uniref:Serine-threonine/tyrosine-protein kinase catalytic domain-containing protein n=1 Tax=Datura stramonium TaxID=4076 RepID=A0ABS8VAG2_DATST|nr:hypothetical protein [Datura stramonium]
MAFKSFDTEREVLCIVRHRNNVKVITSCSNLDFKSLVLEYMPNGCLEKGLYSHNYFGDLSLKQWVSNALPEAVMEVVDANLVTPIDNYLNLDFVTSIMKVALDCCIESLARRTNMKDVIGILWKITIQRLAC